MLPAQIETNNGYAVIPVIIYTSYEDERVYGYTEADTMTGTLFNCTIEAARVAQTPLATEEFTALTSWLTSEEMQDSDYQTKKQSFINKTSFIWGDLESGGCFLAGYQGLIHLGVVYGFFERSYQGVTQYRYVMAFHTLSSQGFTVSNCDEIMIGFTMSTQNSNYPDFIAITKSPTLQLFSRRAEIDAGVFIGYGEKINESNLASATNDCSMYTVLGVVETIPAKIWGGCVEQIFGWGSAQNPEGTLLYGAWHANTIVDVSVNPGYKGGLSDPSTGPGAFPDESRDGEPTDPNASGVDASNSGFITLYNPNKTAIQQFNNFLFSDSITEAMSNALKKLIADPIDYLVFIAMVRFKPPTPSVLLHEIKFCGISSGVSAKVIKPQAAWIKYKTRHIDSSYFGFEDYNPYSKASIHLPYIGFRDLNVDELVDSDVKVTYNVDCMTGSCVAQIHIYRAKRSYLSGAESRGDTKLNDVMYEYTGNCFEMLPLNATDFRGLFGSIMQTAVGVASGAMTGNVIGAASAVIGGAASAKVGIEHSGNMSASAGYFGSQDVYLRLERPIQSLPENYANLQGMPSNVYCRKISDLTGTGYTEFEAESLHLDSLTDATLEEIEEVRNLLSNGMIF